MARFNKLLVLGTALAFCAPQSADALTFVQVLSLLHVATGILLTFVILIFCTGVFVYYARLGTWPSHRDYAIKILEWSVALLSVLILALLRAFQVYTKTMLVILAVVVLLAIAIFIVRGAAAAKSKPHARPTQARPPGK